jgi:hypothetical protein
VVWGGGEKNSSLPACIAPSDTLSSQALDCGVNRLSVFFVFGGGGVSLFLSLRTAGNHPVEKSSMLEKESCIAESSSA